MASAGLDLNQDPPPDESDVNLEPASLHPSSDPGVINWDGIQEWDGPAHELDYDFVWHGNGDDDGDEQGEGTEVGHGDPANANEPDESSDYEGDWHYVPIAPAHGGGGSRNARNQDVPIAPAHDGGGANGGGNQGSNGKKRRFYRHLS